jgi:hypothetical protein
MESEHHDDYRVPFTNTFTVSFGNLDSNSTNTNTYSSNTDANCFGDRKRKPKRFSHVCAAPGERRL